MNKSWILVALIALAAIVKGLFVGRADRSAASPRVPVRADREGSRQVIGRRNLARFPLLRTSDPFDRDGSLIWNTQIPALRAVCEHEPAGAPCAELHPIYVELARLYPEIYEGHTFRDWGQMLVDLGLLRVAGKNIHITQAGQALVEMLTRATQQESSECVPGWAIRLNNACRG